MTLVANETSKINVIHCTNEMEAIWDAFVEETRDGNVFHAYGWKRVFEGAYGNECIFLMAEEEGLAIGVLPLVLKKSRVFGRFLVSLPYFDHVGICSERENARKALYKKAQELGRDKRAEYLELRHDREGGADVLTRQSKVSMILELPPDPKQLWSGFKAKVRNQVRKAEKEGLSMTSGGRELLNGFFEIYVGNMRDLGSPSHSKKFFERICDNFPEAVRIFSVQLGEKAVASGFTIASKDMLTIPWASSLRGFNSKCPNMLLYWDVLKYACDSGFSRFNFGRSTLGEGSYRFKKQWGAEKEQLYWHYWLPNGGNIPELNTDNSKYQLPVKIWKRLPVALTERIGPRLIQHLS
jgi:FemAB-related protein (PEP-CTERM system-associated)